MFRTYSLFKAFGIPVRIHGTLLILLPIFALYMSADGGMAGFSSTLGLLIAAFGCVLLHELGHSLSARRHGIGTHAITLTPIGGLAGLESVPRDPWKELEITAAGPAVNFVLAGLFGVGFLLAPSYFMGALALINIVLGVFNLLPGFPMDGGRILRALLAFRLPYERATVIATKVGQFTAIAMGIYGVVSFRPLLVLVAIFVYLAAAAERRRVLNPTSQMAQQILRAFFQQGRTPFSGGTGAGFPGAGEGPTSPFSSPQEAPPPASGGNNDQDRVVIEVMPDGKIRKYRE